MAEEQGTAGWTRYGITVRCHRAEHVDCPEPDLCLCECHPPIFVGRVAPCC